MAKAFVGTSGFSYPHWGNDVFYPSGLPQNKWLEFYGQHFNSVELNVSFYRLPKKATLRGWRKKAGLDFVFAAKGSRFITHIKKLKDCQEAIKNFFEAAEELKDKEGKNIILWQLPPGWTLDELRMKQFLTDLPRTWRHAFELRNQTWLTSDVFALLEQYHAAVVFQDYPQWPITREITSDFIYIRFHGNKQLYASEYSEEELKNWASDIKNWLRQGKDIYVYFNNDALGYAVSNAKRLEELVSR